MCYKLSLKKIVIFCYKILLIYKKNLIKDIISCVCFVVFIKFKKNS